VKRLLAMALLAVAVPAALAQEQASDDDFNEAVAAANATAAAMAAENTPLARLESGIASWYGKQFHGRKTANGERFDMDALTAAHPKLPFGSWVRVRNLVNGRSVDVRINDRGPHIKRRVIDLSRAAARALGVSGTHQVEISLLDRQAR
jgi:rare lipoprotein A